MNKIFAFGSNNQSRGKNDPAHHLFTASLMRQRFRHAISPGESRKVGLQTAEEFCGTDGLNSVVIGL